MNRGAPLTNTTKAREAAVRRVLADMYEVSKHPERRAIAEKAAAAAWDAGRVFEQQEQERISSELFAQMGFAVTRLVEQPKTAKKAAAKKKGAKK